MYFGIHININFFVPSIDVNECEKDTNICDNSTQECINLIGGYQCKLTRCYNGFNLTDGRCLGK